VRGRRCPLPCLPPLALSGGCRGRLCATAGPEQPLLGAQVRTARLTVTYYIFPEHSAAELFLALGNVVPSHATSDDLWMTHLVSGSSSSPLCVFGQVVRGLATLANHPYFLSLYEDRLDYSGVPESSPNA